MDTFGLWVASFWGLFSLINGYDQLLLNEKHIRTLTSTPWLVLLINKWAYKGNSIYSALVSRPKKPTFLRFHLKWRNIWTIFPLLACYTTAISKNDLCLNAQILNSLLLRITKGTHRLHYVLFLFPDFTFMDLHTTICNRCERCVECWILSGLRPWPHAALGCICLTPNKQLFWGVSRLLPFSDVHNVTDSRNVTEYHI